MPYLSLSCSVLFSGKYCWHRSVETFCWFVKTNRKMNERSERRRRFWVRKRLDFGKMKFENYSAKSMAIAKTSWSFSVRFLISLISVLPAGQVPFDFFTCIINNCQTRSLFTFSMKQTDMDRQRWLAACSNSSDLPVSLWSCENIEIVSICLRSVTTVPVEHCDALCDAGNICRALLIVSCAHIREKCNVASYAEDTRRTHRHLLNSSHADENGISTGIGISSSTSSSSVTCLEWLVMKCQHPVAHGWFLGVRSSRNREQKLIMGVTCRFPSASMPGQHNRTYRSIYRTS